MSRPEYREALERPLINIDGTKIDVASMYATPNIKSAPRTPEAELTANEMFVNKSDGLDRNRNLNDGPVSPTGENGNSSDKEYQELPPPPLPTRRYKNGNNGNNGNAKNSFLGIDDQQKKELMKNYDDVPLRKPLPAPGPVPDVVEESTKIENNKAENKTETSKDCSSITKEGKKEEKTAGSNVTSPVSPRSVEFPKPVVKGKPVDIPIVPELKKIEVKQEEKKVEMAKDATGKSAPAEAKKVEEKPMESSTNAPKISASQTKGQSAPAQKEQSAKKQEDLVLRKTLLQEIKNFSKDIEIKLQNKNRQRNERLKKEDNEEKKKLEELRRKDIQDYPYEDVDVQTTSDGKKQMKSKEKGGKGVRRNEGGKSSPEGAGGDKPKKKSAIHNTFPRKKVGGPGDMMSQSMFEQPTQTADHYDVTTNEPIHMTLEEVSITSGFIFALAD